LLGCGVVGFMLLSILISAIAFWWHVITGTPLR
jgi:cytochrome c oxidase assembly factor CtaG